MLRKIAGFTLIILGVFGAYVFAAIGAQQGQGILSPFRSIAEKYPYSAFALVISITATLGGIIIFATKFPRKATADILLANSLVMLATLSVILLGVKSNLTKVIGFGVVILVTEIIVGVILIMLSFLEKPRMLVDLIFGCILHLAITALTITAILSGI